MLDLAIIIAPASRSFFTINASLGGTEFFNTIEFNDHFVIKPSIKFIDRNIDFRKNKIGEKGKFVRRDFEYSSSNNKDFLSVEKLNKLIKKYDK